MSNLTSSVINTNPTDKDIQEIQQFLGANPHQASFRKECFASPVGKEMLRQLEQRFSSSNDKTTSTSTDIAASPFTAT